MSRGYYSVVRMLLTELKCFSRHSRKADMTLDDGSQSPRTQCGITLSGLGSESSNWKHQGMSTSAHY